METYYPSSSNGRDAVPMLCLREPLPNSYLETPTLTSNITFYMNSGSYSKAWSDNSQQQNNCFVIPSLGVSHSTPEQHEILADIGGFQTGDHDFGELREGRNEIQVNRPMDGQNVQGHGLPLSLGTQTPSGIQMSPIHDRNHSSCFDSFLGTNPSLSGNGAYRSGSSGDECVRNSENIPPNLCRGDISLHGMSSAGRTVPNSKYLKAVKQLLDEVVDIRKTEKLPDMKNSTHEDSKKSSKEDDGRFENDGPSTNGVSNSRGSASNSSNKLSHAEKQDLHKKLTKLLSILDEVDCRYKQYYHQMQIVVSSFDGIAGFGASKPYTALALQTISRHFRCLRDAITGQISATQEKLGEQDASGNNKGIGISRLRYVDQQIRQQTIQQLGMVQHAWRPQRGLPESSVSILRAWLFEHFLHPYPKDCDKVMLERQAGLTRSQVSNWFINARVRLWKPMIEEMYKQENCDADMDSSSSSENAFKVTKSDAKASNDIGDDSQHYQNSIANKIYSGVQAQDLRSDQVLDTEIMASPGLASLQSGGHEGETEHRLVKQTEEQRPNFDDCGLFPDDTVVQSGGANDSFMAIAPTGQMTEFERFKSGTGVSLTLGLQHCDGGNFLPGKCGFHEGT